jgi:hypothetical protein
MKVDFLEEDVLRNRSSDPVQIVLETNQLENLTPD